MRPYVVSDRKRFSAGSCSHPMAMYPGYDRLLKVKQQLDTAAARSCVSRHDEIRNGRHCAYLRIGAVPPSTFECRQPECNPRTPDRGSPERRKPHRMWEHPSCSYILPDTGDGSGTVSASQASQVDCPNANPARTTQPPRATSARRNQGAASGPSFAKTGSGRALGQDVIDPSSCVLEWEGSPPTGSPLFCQPPDLPVLWLQNSQPRLAESSRFFPKFYPPRRVRFRAPWSEHGFASPFASVRSLARLARIFCRSPVGLIALPPSPMHSRIDYRADQPNGMEVGAARKADTARTDPHC